MKHLPIISVDNEGYSLHCSCGKYLGLYETKQEALDMHEDHFAGVYEREK
jgi:hypothetical protein